MSPPSRGSRKAGALAPSLRPGGPPALRGGGFCRAGALVRSRGFDGQAASSDLRLRCRPRPAGDRFGCGRTALTVSREPYAMLSQERCRFSCWRPWPVFLAVALRGFRWRLIPGRFSRHAPWRMFWPVCSRLGAGWLRGGGFGGFLARFLGHTPSFRRFRRINHWDIAGLVQRVRERVLRLGKSDDPGVW